MAEEHAASDPSNPAPPALTQPPVNPVRRLTLIVMAIAAALFLYGIAADRSTPYTSQALVQAYLVKIAPEVSGRVTEVGVGTDQRVEAGKVLFRSSPISTCWRFAVLKRSSKPSDRQSERRPPQSQRRRRSSLNLSPCARTHATRRSALLSWSAKGSIPKRVVRRRRQP